MQASGTTRWLPSRWLSRARKRKLGEERQCVAAIGTVVTMPGAGTGGLARCDRRMPRRGRQKHGHRGPIASCGDGKSLAEDSTARQVLAGVADGSMGDKTATHSDQSGVRARHLSTDRLIVSPQLLTTARFAVAGPLSFIFTITKLVLPLHTPLPPTKVMSCSERYSSFWGSS